MSAKDRMTEVREGREAYRAGVDAGRIRASKGSQRADEEYDAAREETARAEAQADIEAFENDPTPNVETLPVDSEARKNIPLVTGLLDYFPAALAEIAKVSKAGNDKHNPGEPLHWARGKSTDQADCIGRHLLERGGIDPETGQRHSAQMAWRALALLQLELEAAGAPVARGARV